MANQEYTSPSSSSSILSAGHTSKALELEIPIGFRFEPEDWELILHYVNNKNRGIQPPIIIPEYDLYEKFPQSLPGDFKYATGKMYFFTKRKRMSQQGSKIKRSTNGGFWKTTSNDKVIKHATKLIGHKRTFAFYEGKDKIKPKWVMHEFRSIKNKMNDFVLCMIYEKSKHCTSDSCNSAEAMDIESTTSVEANEEVRRTLLSPQSIAQHPSLLTPTTPLHPNQTNEIYDSDFLFNSLNIEGLQSMWMGQESSSSWFTSENMTEPTSALQYISHQPSAMPTQLDQSDSVLRVMHQLQPRVYDSNLQIDSLNSAGSESMAMEQQLSMPWSKPMNEQHLNQTNLEDDKGEWISWCDELNPSLRSYYDDTLDLIHGIPLYSPTPSPPNLVSPLSEMLWNDSHATASSSKFMDNIYFNDFP